MIQMNFCQDVNNLARKRLIQFGFKEEDVKKLENPLINFFEYYMMHIPIKKRKVYKSDIFQCPKQYEKALGDFIQKVKRGEDINPFLSNKKDTLTGKDLLLYDWNIYHFHLTRRYNRNGKPTRSNYLIFAACTDEAMYFIQIYKHQKKNVFVQKELLEIICRNWPQLTAPYEMKEVFAGKITDEERLTIRNKNILTLNDIDGKTYFPPGGGYVSNGTSLKAVHLSDFLLNKMKNLEKWIFLNLISIRQKYEETARQRLWGKQMAFYLVACTEDDYILLESCNHFIIYIQSNNSGFQIKRIKI